MAYDPKKKYDPDLNYNDLANQAAQSGDYALAEHYLTTRENKIRDQGGNDRGVSNESIRQGWAQYLGYTDYYNQPAQTTPAPQQAAQPTTALVPTAAQTQATLAAQTAATPAQNGGMSPLARGDAGGFTHIAAPDTSGLKSTLDQWLANTQKASAAQIDRSVQQGVNELAKTLEEAQDAYQTQQNQVEIQTARARDANALDRATRGDRGGIGAAQADSISNTAAQNLQSISRERTKVRTDIFRQIAQLRANGEFQKETSAVEAANQYLAKLAELEQLKLAQQLTVEQFNAQIDQAKAEYALHLQELAISSDQFNRQMQYQERRDEIADQRYQREYQDSRADLQRQWAYQLEQDAKSDQRYQEEIAYARQQDALNRQERQNRYAVEDKRYADETAYSRGQDALNRKQTAKQAAQSEAYAQLNMGWMPDDATLSTAGISKDYAKMYRETVIAARELENAEAAQKAAAEAEKNAVELESKRASTEKTRAETEKAKAEAAKTTKEAANATANVNIMEWLRDEAGATDYGSAYAAHFARYQNKDAAKTVADYYAKEWLPANPKPTRASEGYGANYTSIWKNVRAMYDGGRAATKDMTLAQRKAYIKNYLNQQDEQALTNAGLAYIMERLNIDGYNTIGKHGVKGG